MYRPVPVEGTAAIMTNEAVEEPIRASSSRLVVQCEHETDPSRMFDCGCGTNDSYCINCFEPMHCSECAA